MSRVVFLHVGAPKTGTTYLQDRLRKNRAELAKHGIHYRLGVYASHFNAALDLLDEPWVGRHGDVEGQWDALVRRVRHRDGTAIIDHEILAAATHDKVRRAKDDLGDSEIHIVYSARDLARQIPAAWQEAVKHGSKRSFKRFAKLVVDKAETPSASWFWRVQSLTDVLNRWSEGLPPARVHLVTVPQPGAPNDLLWRRFCQVFGIDPAWAPKDSSRRNPSIGVAETEMVRRLNARLNSSVIDPATREFLVKELLVHRTLAVRENTGKQTLPEHLYPWAEEITERWIEWVHGSGIDVVGDVDELRPVPARHAEAGASPDRDRVRAMLDAALDALAAMTEEASRRPAPEDHLTAKVGRAARRLRGG
jgi:hypothetical protein